MQVTAVAARPAVFIVFRQDVCDIQERIALQADFDKCRVHAGQDIVYFCFVKIADDALLAFDMQLGQLFVHEDRNARFSVIYVDNNFFCHFSSSFLSAKRRRKSLTRPLRVHPLLS